MKALKMCTKNINLQNIEKIFTSFGQNTAAFYDKHILITVLCIFWPESVLKPRYFTLYLTENGSVPPLDTRLY